MDFDPSVELFEGVQFELQSDSPTVRKLQEMELQMEITERWRQLCEAALLIKTGAAMNGMDLLILGGTVINDPDFFQGSLVPGSVFSKAPMDVARAMTREEKLVLRARLQKRGVLPRK